MYRFFLILALSLPAYGGGEVSDIVKKNSEFINDFAADSIYSFFTGPGYTEVEMRGIENKKPEFSILFASSSAQQLLHPSGRSFLLNFARKSSIYWLF